MKHEQSMPATNDTIDTIMSRVMRAAPWLSEPVAEAVRGVHDNRKASRVLEMMDDVFAGLEGFQSELSELYAKTPDFRALMGRVVEASGNEPRAGKRRLYAAFLVDSIVSPLESAENQARMLDTLKQLKMDHVRILRTLAVLPVQRTTYIMSPLQTLREQLRDIPQERMRGLLTQLTEMGITTVPDWSSGAYGDPEQIRKQVTPLGMRLMRIIEIYARREPAGNESREQE